MQLVKQKGYDFDSMYIGGGTPTILLDELCQTIDRAREMFSIREVSCETNPNHLDQHLVDLLGKRVQRLSVGIQSFDDGLLKKINRYDRFGDGKEQLRRLQSVNHGFDSLNVDMIFNFPGQTLEMIQRDIQDVFDSGVNQATFYPLMSSPSVERALKSRVGQVNHDHEGEFYRAIVAEMAQQFEFSSAWTFSRKGGGLIDEYIIESEEYVGIGSGAFSYLHGGLLVNTFSIDQYLQLLGEGRHPITGKRVYSLKDQQRYRFMMDLFGLRLDKAAWKARFGEPVERSLPFEMAFFQAVGAFAVNDSKEILLSNTGRYFLIIMMREFFSGINQVRDQARQAVFNNGGEKATQAVLHPMNG